MGKKYFKVSFIFSFLIFHPFIYSCKYWCFQVPRHHWDLNRYFFYHFPHLQLLHPSFLVLPWWLPHPPGMAAVFSWRHYITARAALLLIPWQPTPSTHTHTHTYACMHIQKHVHVHEQLCLYVFGVNICSPFAWTPAAMSSPSSSHLCTVETFPPTPAHAQSRGKTHTLTHHPNLPDPRNDVFLCCDILTDDLRCRMTLLLLPVSVERKMLGQALTKYFKWKKKVGCLWTLTVFTNNAFCYIEKWWINVITLRKPSLVFAENMFFLQSCFFFFLYGFNFFRI